MVEILQLQISLNKSVKNTYLVHKHAIKSKTKTKQILQKLAFDTNYHSTFPSHRNQAKDYFEKQKQRMITLLLQRLNTTDNDKRMEVEFMSIDDQNDDINNNDYGANITNEQDHIKQIDLSEIQQFMTKLDKLQSMAKNNNHTEITVNIEDLQRMFHLMDCLKDTMKNQSKTIDILTAKIQELEEKNSTENVCIPICIICVYIELSWLEMQAQKMFLSLCFYF